MSVSSDAPAYLSRARSKLGLCTPFRGILTRTELCPDAAREAASLSSGGRMIRRWRRRLRSRILFVAVNDYGTTIVASGLRRSRQPRIRMVEAWIA